MIEHQYNAHGRHRLVINGVASRWEPYRSPVIFKGYMALTEYYGKDQVFIVSETDYKITNTPRAIKLKERIDAGDLLTWEELNEEDTSDTRPVEA